MEIENKYKDLVSFAIIGEGSFAKVYKAVDPKTNKKYALKVQSLAKSKINLLERDIHVRGDPAFIVRAYFTGVDSLNTYILQDYFEGDLTLFPFRDLFKASYVAHQIGRCITYLHSVGIIHRDIKPTNLLMTYDYRVKLTDFGISARVGEEVHHISGTPAYIAPEAIHCQPCLPASDWFAFGLVIFYLMTGKCFSQSTTFLESHNYISNSKNVKTRICLIDDADMQAYVRQYLHYRASDRTTYTKSLEQLGGTMQATVKMTHDEFLATTDGRTLISRRPKYIMNEKMLDKAFFFDKFTRIDGVHAAKFRNREKGRFIKENTIPLYHGSPQRSNCQPAEDDSGYFLRERKS
ncbi:unnamed protein product [Allacma fusca]|uniref:Serine/threonine-protein kinase greatwall n=1 Tax=Allacma fusca TaxID=39272 RepID=A0A8J2NRM2_9HEXA|nr:unnamed protein product [Allacma fusca]